MEGWKPNPDPLCQKCGEQPAGPGGIICPDCKVAIETANVELITRPTGRGLSARGQPEISCRSLYVLYVVSLIYVIHVHQVDGRRDNAEQNSVHPR
jgi:hypothetical protein